MMGTLALLVAMSAWALPPKDSPQAKSFRKTVVGKRDYFVPFGLFHGGECDAEAWTLKSVRQGQHTGFKRLAFEWTQLPIPYFQVALKQDGGFVQVTFWGRPQFADHVRTYLRRLDAWLKPLDGFDQVFWTSHFSVGPGAGIEVFLHEMHPILVIDVREGLPRANSSTP
jgi:hypothetical protein